MITCTVISRADDSCEAGVSLFIVGQDMLQVVQTEGFLISTLPQSLFLFNGVEPNLNSRCPLVYALSPNFSGKLVVSAVLQSKLSMMLSLLITWG